MNKSKSLGTAAESAVANYLRSNFGFSDAQRRTLSGQYDQGDIWVTSGFIVEVKSRSPKSSNAGLGQPAQAELDKWLRELDNEMVNAGALKGILVVKRSRTTDVGRWWAYMRLGCLLDYALGALAPAPYPQESAWVCMEFKTAVQVVSGLSGVL